MFDMESKDSVLNLDKFANPLIINEYYTNNVITNQGLILLRHSII